MAVNRRADIFAAGILLYELTVGRRLFKRDNGLLAFYAICHEPIPPSAEPGRSSSKMRISFVTAP